MTFLDKYFLNNHTYTYTVIICLWVKYIKFWIYLSVIITLESLHELIYEADNRRDIIIKILDSLR